MSLSDIKDYIKAELSPAEQEVAMNLIEYLENKGLVFHKDNGSYWKDKIYYWILYNELCVCFIAIKDPGEPDNHWTVWSDDIGSDFLTAEAIDEQMKEVAFKHIDTCRCGGGPKTVFGEEIEWVCGTNFRFDNPTAADLPFIKKIIELKIEEIDSGR